MFVLKIAVNLPFVDVMMTVEVLLKYAMRINRLRGSYRVLAVGLQLKSFLPRQEFCRSLHVDTENRFE